MKHIAFIISHYIGGGAERVTDIIAHGLIQRGNKVSLITAEIQSKHRNHVESIYSNVIVEPGLGRYKKNVTVRLSEIIKNLGIDSVALLVDDYPDLENLREALPGTGRIIYHPHNTPYYKVRAKTTLNSSINTLLKRVDWFITKQMPEILLKKYSRRYALRIKATASTVDAYILLSDLDTQQLQIEYPEYSNKFHTLRNPLTLPSPHELPVKQKEVIYLGRLDPIQKRVDRLIKIFAKSNARKLNWKLKIVGDGPDKANLQQLCKSLNIEDIVEFHDFTDNPTKDLSTASILCLTSEYEGYSLVLTEAMQYGVVPMAYACSNGLKELLSHNRGILIAPYCEDDYVRSLCELMSSDETRQQICKNQQEFLQSISNNEIISSWEKLLTT